MRRTPLTTLAALLALDDLAGCRKRYKHRRTHQRERQGIEGSGDLVTLELDFADFTRLGLAHSIRGTITQSDAFRVTIRVDDNIVDRLRINRTEIRVEGNSIARADSTRTGDELQTGLEDGSYNNITSRSTA